MRVENLMIDQNMLQARTEREKGKPKEYRCTHHVSGARSPTQLKKDKRKHFQMLMPMCRHLHS